MTDLIRVLPYILGAAISPVLLVMTLFVLSRPKQPIKKALMFLAGSAATLLAISGIIFITTTIGPKQSSTNDLLPHIIIGLLLLFLAFNIYHRGPAKATTKAAPKDGPFRYLALGAVLMATNFTTIAMIFEVALELRADSIYGLAKIAYLMLVVLFGLMPVLVPLIILILAGKRSPEILASLSNFMNKYAHIVTAIFFVILGLFSLAKPFI